MHVLVTTASRHGGTADIGQAIADAITLAGHHAVVVRAEEVTSASGYDAVVLGSAVYAGRWLAPAKKLVDEFGTELAAKPVWLFSSGPAGDPSKPEGDPADVPPIVERIRPRGHRVFAGRIDRSTLGFAERAIVRVVKAPEGDFRPWTEIREWANEIAREIDAITPAGVAAD